MHVNLTLMMAFEDGSITPENEVKLFSELISSGMAWKLQGFYGRHAQHLINAGYIDRNGKIL